MIKNNRYADGMAKLGDLSESTYHVIAFDGAADSTFTLYASATPPGLDVIAIAVQVANDAIVAAVASGTAPFPLGKTDQIIASLKAWTYQDDDAHDTCSLTACLNPLHPGPCKGWKGTLHKVAPGAWKQVEAARVAKANAKRVAKIQELKAQGKPIPKKLLTPIVAKPHPNAGKEAASAGGEAHEAGKAISQANGVKTNEPGKHTLGQAVKTVKVTDATDEKGAKGKKPTVASKGIAAVIAQDKVTPQYKLDKAAKITPEQWEALSGSEQDVIRGELAKIKKDGFGPQQKKATDLLESLDRKQAPATPAEEKALAPQAKKVAEAESKVSAAEKKVADAKAALEAHKAKPKLSETYTPKPKPEKKAPAAPAADKPAQKLGGPNEPSSPAQKEALAKIVAGEKFTPAAGQPGVNKLTLDALHNKGLIIWDKQAGHYKPADGKTPSDLFTPANAGLKKAEPAAPKLGDATPKPTVKKAVEDLIKNGLPKPSSADTAVAKAVAKTSQPAHIKHAVDMANGKALGASWSKNHLAAYEKLTPEEFQTLDPDTKSKILAELKKGETKFLDPKKKAAAAALADKFSKAKTSAAPESKPAAKAPASFAKDMLNHSVSQAEAKQLADAAPISALQSVAFLRAGVSDLEDPDSPARLKSATSDAQSLTDGITSLYDSSITGQPDIKQAMAEFKKAKSAELYAKYVAEAKKKAYNKVSKTLYADSSPMVTDKLSPIEKAALLRYQKHLLDHPVKTGPAEMDDLSDEAKQAKKGLEDKLQAALKKANAPAPDKMSPAQISDRAGEILGWDAVSPSLVLTPDDLKSASSLSGDLAKQVSSGYDPAVLANPAVAAKLAVVQGLGEQYMKTTFIETHLKNHIGKNHNKTLLTGKDVNGGVLTADDKKIIALHKDQLADKYSYLPKQGADQLKQLNEAKAAFKEIADKTPVPAKPQVTLSDFDKQTIGTVYAKAWGDNALKAVSYGTTGLASAKMKEHSQYPAFSQNVTDLRELSGKVALAHAEAEAAKANVPTEPDTGIIITGGPEWKVWHQKVNERDTLESQFSGKLYAAQKQLDTIRTAAGLKKRSLPKIDSPAVKAAAAEGGYYKSASYNGPNFGKTASAKQYMAAKVGPKLGVAHLTAQDKKLGKLGNPAAPAATKAATPAAKKATGAPVTLGGGSSTANVPDAIKGSILSNFKGMPKGKYLADPTEDVFDNLVNLTAAYSKDVPGGLSVDQVLKSIDEKHSKSLGVANAHMMEKKVTDWLATPAGKAYAQANSTPDPKVVKELTGELTMPKGVTLAPGQKVQDLAGPGKFDKSLAASAFHAATSAQAKAWQDEYLKANGIVHSAKQKAAIKRYTENGLHAFTGMNNWLRGDGSFAKNVKQDVLDVQASMIPMPKHMLLLRGTGWPPDIANFQSHPEDMVGKTFEDKGFVSTSVAGSGGHFSSHPLQLTIEAPAGTPGAFVQPISAYGGENEMLLAAGLKFKVISVEQKNGKTHMRVRVVGVKTNEGV